VPRLLVSFGPPKRKEEKLSLAFKTPPPFRQKSVGERIIIFKGEILDSCSSQLSLHTTRLWVAAVLSN